MKQTNKNNTLLKRTLITLGILTFIRLGTFLPVPGIDHGYLSFYIQRHSLTRSLTSTFSGNDMFIIGLFTLNIFPYINASIIIQLLTAIVPSLSKLQKEGTSEGRRTINRIIRIITLVWALIQSTSIALYLKRALFDWTPFLAIEIIIWLTTGSLIVLWLSEIITEYGLGNGPSLLIYINIISNFPNIIKKLISENSENLSLLSLCVIIGLFLIAIYGIVLLQEGTRIIPLISSKELNQSMPTFSILPENNYIPLRFNLAGVMPIILTSGVLVVPNYFNSLGLIPIVTLPAIFNSSKLFYGLCYFVLILVFSSFYSTIVLNPKDVSDDLQKMAVSIPGLRPGTETTYYLTQVIKRVTLLGAVMLAILASLPNIIETILPVSNFNGLGTTSLLILVGVILDLSREIKGIFLSSIYNDMLD
ncbi:MAG: preprotein translocase subunit SecY [Pelagibacterales bacterium]|nr:preprotein translocase subunit SecY [Pelagibacterales bacterium]